jgi:cation transport ATPase
VKNWFQSFVFKFNLYRYVAGLALTPSVAGGLMGFSSLGVMGNSLLLQLTSRKLSKGLPTVVSVEELDEEKKAS